MYDANLYDRSLPPTSYWASEAPPLELPRSLEGCGDVVYDVAILGAGFTGLSAAYHLAKRSKLTVCVLEAGKVGCGASGLNGGFCNVSPSRSPDSLDKQYGETQTRAFMKGLYDGVELVRDLLSEEKIDAQPQFGGSYEVAHTPAAFSRLEMKAELLSRRFGIEGNLVSRDRFDEIGHRSPEQYGALHRPTGFCLDPLRFANGLALAAAQQGAEIYEDSPVERLEKHGAIHELTAGKSKLRARRLIIATNAYTPERLHSQFTARLMPVISHIITTRPLSREELDAQGWATTLGCGSTHATLFYYRILPDGRLMFGGPGDTTGTLSDASRNADRLLAAMRRRFPAWRTVTVSHSWRGLVCTSRKFAPSVGEAGGDPTVLYGLGYQGNGVATSTWTGKQLAAVTAGQESLSEAFPDPMLGLGAKFPLPALRPLYLRAALRLMRLRD